MAEPLANVLLFLIRDHSNPAARRLVVAWYACLFAAGALLWGAFIEWGRGPYDYHDWGEVNIPRLQVVQQAVRAGALPLHSSVEYPLGNITDRFLTVPDVIVSPQVILLRWMSVETFVLADLLLYAAGFAGLAWLAKRQKLSPLAFTILFMLFNFNGHMLAHISVGHLTWVAQFLLPWVVGLALQALDEHMGWDWVLKAAALLFAILLQGGYHQFIWSLFLLGLLALAAPRHTLRLFEAAAGAVLLSAVRLAPLAMNLGRFGNEFLSGYPSLLALWSALLQIDPPHQMTSNMGLTGEVGLWEFTCFTGLAGVAFLGWFGIFYVARAKAQCGMLNRLLVVIAGLALLSLDQVYRSLRAVLPLPIFTGERVSARIISLALLLLLVLAVTAFQRWLDSQPRSPGFVLGWLALLAFAAHDLWQNYRIWRVYSVAGLYERTAAGAAGLANRYDPEYLLVLAGGAVISLLTLMVLLRLARHREAPSELQAGAPRRRSHSRAKRVPSAI